jgi:hypothetical protein
MVRGSAAEEIQCYMMQYLKEASGVILRAIKPIAKACIRASELERGYEEVKCLEVGPLALGRKRRQYSCLAK